MTDQEKIEAAATAMWAEIPYREKQPHIKTVYKEAVAWRDNNPSPHVVALVEALRAIRDKRTCEILNPPHQKYKNYEDGWNGVAEFAGNALAQFEKAVKP